MATTKIRALDGEEIKLYSNNNTESGNLAMVSTSLRITGGSTGVAIASGNDFKFEGASHVISGNGASTLSVGISGDAINLNVSGVTYNIGTLTGSPTITGNVTAPAYRLSYSSLTRDFIAPYGGDVSGLGVRIESGAALIVGAGESASAAQASLSATSEQLWLTSDGNVAIYTSVQSGWAGRKEFLFDSSGNLTIAGDFMKGATRVSYEGHSHTVSSVTWPGNQNIIASATANNQEWSIDLTPGSYTGTYFHVYSTGKSTCLKVEADNGKVSAMYDAYVGGNLGVGTVPNSLRKLDVSGDIRLTGGFYSNASFSGFYTDGASAQPIKTGSLSVTDVYGDTAPSSTNAYIKGSAGIGIISPASKLHVYAGSPGTTYKDTYTTLIVDDVESRIQLRSLDTGTSGSSIILTNGAKSWSIAANSADDSNKLHIGYRSSAANEDIISLQSKYLTIDTSGKVGIGETAPSYKLDILANQGMVRLRSADTSAGGYAEMHIENDATNRLIMGGVGSGYTSADWVGSTYIYNTGSGRKMYIKSQDRIDMFAGGTSLGYRRFSILPDGKVGIGNVSPNYTLDVTGTVHVTGATTLDSTLSITGATTAGDITSSGVISGTLKGAAKNYTSVTFTKGTATLISTWTHNLGSTNYVVTLSANSPERHVYWANKTANAIDICIDDSPYDSDVIVNCILLPY